MDDALRFQERRLTQDLINEATQRKIARAIKDNEAALQDALRIHADLIGKGRDYAMHVLNLVMAFDFPDLDY